MKLKFNRPEMADALGVVCGVTAARTTKEILKCVRVEAQSDVVILTATDLELGVRYALTQVEVTKPGDTLLLADTLNRIVRECSEEVLQADTQDAVFHIRGKGSHFQIVTQAPTDFPPVPGLEGEPTFTIDYGSLRRLVEWTVFAAARESTRYAINGVLWEIRDGKLILAATDGRRLSVGSARPTQLVGGAVSAAIVPVKTLALFSRLTGDADAPVSVRITNNQIVLKLGGVVISSHLVEGHFPRYQDVIPADSPRVAEVNTAEFLAALRQAALLTNEESRGVRLAFDEGMLTLSSRAPEQGEATISMPVRYRNEATEIGFNPVFLTDALRAVHEDEITFSFKEPNRPGVIRLGEDFVHVVMPVNL